MVALTKQEKDVVDRFERLPPERQRYVMLLMFRSNPEGWRELLGDSASIPRPGTPEWLKAFDAWVSSHPASAVVADDSRDTIYGEGRD